MLMFLLYIFIGSVAGILAGLLGIGGGVIVVPALAAVFQWQGMPSEFIMQMAAASSLAAMIVSAVISVWTHQRHQVVIWPIYRQLAIGIVIGTVVGVIVAHLLKTRLLHLLFGCVLLWVAASLFFDFKKTKARPWPHPAVRTVLSFTIGCFAGLFGIGGGAIAIPLLHYFNVPMRDIIGISAAISFTVALIGSIAYMIVGSRLTYLPPGSIGYVYWPAVLGIIVTSPLFAFLGATLSHRLPVPLLRRIFAVFLVIIGLKMIF